MHNLDITSEFLDSKAYAKTIAESLDLKRFPNLIRYSLIMSSSMIGLVLLFLLTALIANIYTFIERPVIELNGNQITWEPIDNAETYYVVVNNETPYATKETTYDIEVLDYSQMSIYVYAESSSRFFVRSKNSNIVYFSVSDFEFDRPRDVEVGNGLQITTNVFGIYKDYIHIPYGGKYKPVSQPSVTQSKLKFKIIDINLTQTTIEPDSNGYYELNSSTHYIVEITYLPNESFTYYLEPLLVNLNTSYTFARFESSLYQLNTTFSPNTFITLDNYVKDILLDNPHDISQNSGPAYYHLAINPHYLSIINNSDLPKSYTLIKKDMLQMDYNQTLNITEKNQVEVVKLERQIHYKTLYIKFDSRYYDIHFIDNYFRMIYVYKQASGTITYITMPLIHNSSIERIMMILIPKASPFNGQTSVQAFFEKPLEGNYLPH